jgi:transcriptional regulator with XRE-family HTH domain
MSISRTGVARETPRRMRRLRLQIGEDIRRIRMDAGASLGQLSTIVGTHKSHLARIENGDVQPSLEVLAAIGVALGADLSVRYYPGSGPRIHDRFQAPMVETLLSVLDPRWSAEVEVPILRPSRGVIDVVLTERTGVTIVATEVQTEMRRLEQQLRWSAEKADGLAARLNERLPTEATSVSRMLVLRSTVALRDIARRYSTTLATAYPARSHDCVLALTSPNAPWPGAGIVWMRVHGSQTTLLSYPPPNVSLGR